MKAPNNCRNQRVRPCGALLCQKSGFFLPFWGHITSVHRLAWNFARPSGPTCPSAVPNFTWISAMSRPWGAKMLIFWLE